jgi:hypothetical protein
MKFPSKKQTELREFVGSCLWEETRLKRQGMGVNLYFGLHLHLNYAKVWVISRVLYCVHVMDGHVSYIIVHVI